MKYLGVVVFHPLEGLAVANIHPIGNLYLETGMNETGLFLELNNGEQSDSGFDPQADDTSSVLLSVLASSSTIDEAFAMLKATPADLSYIIQLADSFQAVSVERATFGCRMREGKYPGLLAAYNSFVPPYPPEWEGLVNPPPSPAQDPRLENLWNTANSSEFKGKLRRPGHDAVHGASHGRWRGRSSPAPSFRSSRSRKPGPSGCTASTIRTGSRWTWAFFSTHRNPTR